MKEVKNIVKISKSEMEYLVKNGVKFGENGLVKTKHKAETSINTKICTQNGALK